MPHPYEQKTIEAIQQAGLCEGCPSGIACLQKAAQLAIEDAHDNNQPDEILEAPSSNITGNNAPRSLLDPSKSIREGRKDRRTFSLDRNIARIAHLGQINAETPCEGGLRNSQLPRAEKETWMDTVDDAYLADLDTLRDEMRSFVAKHPEFIDTTPVKCELEVRNGERMRNVFHTPQDF
jgi:hypothetical protein